MCRLVDKTRCSIGKGENMQQTKNGATGATEDCNMLVFSVKTGARKGENGATEVLL